MCPISPRLTITKTDNGYAVTNDDMRDLLHYITDLEYAADCRQ